MLTQLKEEFQNYCSGYTKYFIKQGSFSLYHSKELDNLIKKAHKAILAQFFEDYLPHNENIPFCILATKAYSDFKLGANESVPLLFIYKDIKAFHLKPMIKAFIALLNDMGLVIEYQVCELGGILGKANELKPFGVRYLCGSKALFKAARDEFKKLLQVHKDEFAKDLFEHFRYPNLIFIKQEFNIKKDFGGLDDYFHLHFLLTLFKDSPKSYALHFMSEKELSELRLAVDYLLSLQSAINIQSGKDSDTFLFANADEISFLMGKKDKKHLEAKYSMIQKAMNSLHTVGIYTHFIVSQLSQKGLKFQPVNEGFVRANGRIFINARQIFSNLKAFLDALNALNDEYIEFDVSVIMYLKRMRMSKKDYEQALPAFKTLLYRRHSFAALKLFFDSGILKELIKAYAALYFLPDEESVYSRDENAFLSLKAFEAQMNSFEVLKNLSWEEKVVLKLSILISASNEENEVSLSNIYRSLCAKFNVSNESLEFGLKMCKYFHLMKEYIEKEDIYNETIIASFISKLGNERNLRILHALTLINAQALNIHQHFFYKSLDNFLQNALSGFENEEFLDESARRVKKEQALKRSKAFLQLDSTMQDRILHISSNLFIIKNSFETIVSVAQMAKEQDFKFWFDNEKNFILELISRNDRLDLESILSTLSSLNLVFMSFSTLFDDKVYLKFEYANELSDEQRDKFAILLEKNLHTHKNKPKKPMIKKDELKLDLGYSKTYAKLNLNTKDEQGLMAFVMNVFNELKLTLSAAKIQTIRQRTRNTFYLEKTPNLNEESLVKSLTSE